MGTSGSRKGNVKTYKNQKAHLLRRNLAFSTNTRSFPFLKSPIATKTKTSTNCEHLIFAHGSGSIREFHFWEWFCKDVSLIALFFAEVDGVNSQIFNANRVIILFFRHVFSEEHDQKRKP